MTGGVDDGASRHRADGGAQPQGGGVLNLCAPERTARRNTHLALVLTAIAGILNSVGFVAVATYTSYMTGIVASMAGAAGYLWLGFEVVIPVAGVLLLIAYRRLIRDLQNPWLIRRPRRR